MVTRPQDEDGGGTEPEPAEPAGGATPAGGSAADGAGVESAKPAGAAAPPVLEPPSGEPPASADKPESVSDDAASQSAAGRPPPRGRHLLGLCVAALGVVYGDIGTSPLYAIRECFHGNSRLAINHENVLGILSLIAWSLLLVIAVKYLVYVMRADNRGEGGILALMALAVPARSAPGWGRAAIVMAGLFGAALLYGDGMITPVISVLSAVEGLEVATPVFAGYAVPITIAILVALFSFQKRGTASVGAVFGPVTMVWFVVIAALGIRHIVAVPEILWALLPTHAVRFFWNNGSVGFFALGAIFLVVTGGEALYADMGHFGRRPIVLTWFAMVLPALLLNYFGQGAMLLRRPATIANPFYLMAPSWALYPLVVLSTCATVIASQAVISGAFSLSRQATMLGFFPRMKIEHTSDNEIGQIYVPSINTLLLLCAIALALGFGSSGRLAAAYGVAVTTTMVITTLLAFVVARRRWGWSLPAALGLTALFLVPDLAFFAANMAKIAAGGWFPLLVAAAFFTAMTTWKRGRALLGKVYRQRIVPLTELFHTVEQQAPPRVPGTAVFMTSNLEGTPPALMQNFLHNHVLHEQIVLLTIQTKDTARVAYDERVETRALEHGFVRVVAHYGFMEEPDIPALLARDDTPTPPIEHTTFFLGRETLLPLGQQGMPRWRERLFVLLSRNATNATSFFHIPHDRVFEVGAHIEI